VETSDIHTSTVIDAARAGEPDRYLAALLSPPGQREALLTLAAFSAELSAIPLRVREPAVGEIRLQWWRDALAMPPVLRTGSPIADAVRQAALRHELPGELLEAMVDGRASLLPMVAALGSEDMRDHLWKTEGALFALGARVTGVPMSAEAQAACAACGHAYGLVRLLLRLPQMLAHGRIPLATAQLEAAGLTAEDLLSGVADARSEALVAYCSAEIRRSLSEARQFTAALPRPNRVAFLPLALVEPYLRALQRSGHALLRQETSVAPLTRVGRIAAAHLLGRL
jgi:15-cis-phytoene synthase